MSKMDRRLPGHISERGSGRVSLAQTPQLWASRCPQNKSLGGPGHMTSPACCVPRAGPGQWSPPPFPHLVCRGLGGPGQTSTDKRQTLVASGWQALPLDYRRGIMLPLPALPLRVAPEHPGKPPGVSTALATDRGTDTRGQKREHRDQTGGASGVLDLAEGSWPTLSWPGLAPGRTAAASVPEGTQHSHSQCPGPWLAQTYLEGGGRTPQGQPHALRLQVPQGTYEMLEARPEGAA